MAVSSIQVYNLNILHSMSKERRPSSCRLQRASRYSTLTIQPQAKLKKQQNTPNDAIMIRVSFMRRHVALDPPTPVADTDSRGAINSSCSKFLEKFNSIRRSRETIDLGQSPKIKDERRRKEEFERNKKRLYISNRVNNVSTQNISMSSPQLPEQSLQVVDNTLHRPLTDRRRSRPASPSIEFVELRKISVKELILLKEEGQSKQRGEQTLTGFWKGQNRFISLIPLARNEKVSFQHPNILPIYAEVTIKTKRYVISDQYKNCSLKHLLEEFGPFQEHLGKKYLKQIALGLQHMHFHRRGHNRLSTTAILYNKNGELFINAVRSTSCLLSKEELTTTKDLHYFAPEFLLSKGYSRSLKNDVWALGCLAILMLTSSTLPHSALHPYNFQQYRNTTQEQMIDNLKQIHAAYFSQAFQPPKGSKAGRETLSESSKDFICKCLQPLSDERPSIEVLLEHQFFQGV